MEHQNGKIVQLQSLRFGAFLLIYLWHADSWVPGWFPHDLGAGLAVSFFFILSGFVSVISLYDKESSCSPISIYRFLTKKIKKFYPLYFWTTFWTISTSGFAVNLIKKEFWYSQYYIEQLWKNLLLIQSWFNKDYFMYNGVGWFLSTVFFLYILELPLKKCGDFIKEKKNSVQLFIYIMIAVYAISMAYAYLVRNLSLDFWQHVFPPARLGEFILGICLGYIVKLCGLPQVKSINTKAKIWFTLGEILTLIIWVGSLYTPILVWQKKSIHWIVPNLLLIFIFSVGKGYISRVLQNSFLVWLGELSFPCYLIHPLVLDAFNKNVGSLSFSKFGCLFSICFCLLSIIGISGLLQGYSYQKLKRTYQ